MWHPWKVRRALRQAQDGWREAQDICRRGIRTWEDLFALNRELSAQLAAARIELAEQLVPVSTGPSIGEDMQAGEMQAMQASDIPQFDDSFLRSLSIEPIWYR